MTRVDLDALDLAAGYADDHSKELIWDAIAELRPAREVVKLARRARELGVFGGSNFPEREIDRIRRSLTNALAAYDKAVGA